MYVNDLHGYLPLNTPCRRVYYGYPRTSSDSLDVEFLLRNECQPLLMLISLYQVTLQTYLALPKTKQLPFQLIRRFKN